MFNLSTLSGINLQTDNYFQYTSCLKSSTKKTHLRFKPNTSTFYVKRPYVLLQTQGRFESNARAFFQPIPTIYKAQRISYLTTFSKESSVHG